jgi:hypothetical protein
MPPTPFPQGNFGLIKVGIQSHGLLSDAAIDQLSPADFGSLRSMLKDTITPNGRYTLSSGISVIVTGKYVILCTHNNNVVVMNRLGGNLVYVPPGDINYEHQLQAANIMLDAIRGMQTPNPAVINAPPPPPTAAVFVPGDTPQPSFSPYYATVAHILLGVCISAAICFGIMPFLPTPMSTSLAVRTESLTQTSADIAKILSKLFEEVKDTAIKTDENSIKIDKLNDRVKTLENERELYAEEKKRIAEKNRRITEENRRIAEENRRFSGKKGPGRRSTSRYDDDDVGSKTHTDTKDRTHSDAEPKDATKGVGNALSIEFANPHFLSTIKAWTVFAALCAFILVACFISQCWPLTN